MPSSLNTLIKILRLEQQKEYQNSAVIGGLSRFSFHWAREAHGQAASDEARAEIDTIAARLRDYDSVPVDQRPAEIEAIINMASAASSATDESIEVSVEPTPGGSTTEADQSGEDLFEQAFAEGSTDEPKSDVPVEAPKTVRQRRGYAWKEKSVKSPLSADDLHRQVGSLPNVGDKRDEMFEKLNVRTVGDLLYFFPRRHDDYSQMKMIRKLTLGEDITVIGTLGRIQKIHNKNGTLRIEAYLEDDSGSLRLNWFNQPWMEEKLKEGEAVVSSGKVEQYLGRLVMNSPELEPLESEWLQAGRIVPVYHLTKGLTGKFVRKTVKSVVDEFSLRITEYLPTSVVEDADLMDLGDAVSQVHFPDSREDLAAALHRLAFDDLFVLHLAMLHQRHIWQTRRGNACLVEDTWLDAFRGALPYALTSAQEQAIQDVRADLSSDLPMNRLLQGDVGSGKTVVAAVAMGIAIANGAQAALMAPTGILADQHYQSVAALLGNSPVGDGLSVALLTGQTSTSDRNSIFEGLANGSVHAVVGTHALLEPGVRFANLGLAVVDEQHRFGVEQRAALRDKGGDANPHLLVMTATPIPRTLALTVHADLDLTVINEMPPGRLPVETRVIQPRERERAYSFIRTQIEKGHQAFVIYPLIDESDKLDARAATLEYKRLQETVFKDLSLGLLHGRLKPDEKDFVMESFYTGQTQILVSTSVIEVGIDVPNATVMLIENANRFGLAQLHQLRGRIGRGGNQGYCLLMSDDHSLDGDDRLKAVEENSDGFALAEIDWRQRGAGDLLGVQQSGFGRIDRSLLMDSQLVALVQREARSVFEKDPEFRDEDNQLLAQKIQQYDASGDIS